MKTIVDNYELETKNFEQLESIFDSLVRDRNEFIGWLLDYNCGEHLSCKFGRVLRCIQREQNHQDEDFFTYLLTGQLWFHPYNDDVMMNPGTRN